MGSQQSVPTGSPATATPSPSQPVSSVSACPVAHDKKTVPSNQTSNTSDITQCPVQTKDAKKYQNPKVYNVYNQPIDPKNQMPSNANQQPAPDQTAPLSINREASSIPKGGTENTWVYPSPQMFWNALVRKDKTEGVSEQDMDHVVRIHNNMNEATWHKILEWEKLHTGDQAEKKKMEGTEPKLLRFLGRPDELSPKARLKMLLGHAAPFDRHDWVVDRGGKQEVRYIIDYYHDEAAADRDMNPQHMQDHGAIRSIKVDVRPALDSFDNIVDRVIRMPLLGQLGGRTKFDYLPLLPPSETKIAEQRKLKSMQQTWNLIKDKCVSEKEILANCKNPRECENAAIALQMCTASVICPSVAKDFNACLRATPTNQQQLDVAYDAVVKCVELFTIDSRNTLQQSGKTK